MATYEHTWYIPMYLPIHLHTQAQWLKSQTYISYCICCQVHSYVAMCFHVCTYPSAHAGTVCSDVAIHIHMLQYVFIYFHIHIAIHIHHSVYVYAFIHVCAHPSAHLGTVAKKQVDQISPKRPQIGASKDVALC